jgi:hypothetical protein
MVKEKRKSALPGPADIWEDRETEAGGHSADKGLREHASL